ncbi:DUF1109 domain-containing protein [Pseudomonas sp. Kh13]|uniref:DUF1109 domain-containing protein n=1 Tax=Pseudomonas sp. Kh13 TaxID=2093744 RepID=UPI00118212D3|nr:DUF1109 domain-containing protein [Pseudomonas sp. Kh13]
MKTDDWIALLAAGEAPVHRHASLRRLLWATLAGAVGAVLMTATLFGMRADLVLVAHTPLFWAKLALPASLAVLALGLTQRLARPGVKGGVWWGLPGGPLLLVWLGAAASLLSVAPEARPELILGRTWRTCPLNISLLSIPTFIAVCWAIRGLAPTRLRQAGAAGGMLAGATATLAYCLHCPEMAVPFWGLWYVLGMAVPTALGAALGPRLLRW